MIYGTNVFRSHKDFKNLCLLNRLLKIAYQCIFKFSGVGNIFPFKKNSHAVNYFIFNKERHITKDIPNSAILMQFLTEGWYFSWCISYSLTNLVSVYYDNSINNANIKNKIIPKILISPPLLPKIEILLILPSMRFPSAFPV
jgi:hypothetical protein